MFEQLSLENVSILTYLIAFFFGILVCATPCVYPVIPAMIGYFGGSKTTSKRDAFFNALTYVLGLSLVYSALGAFAALSGGLFGVLQNSIAVRIIVANIFILMGLFMLDVFSLPQVNFFQNMPIKNSSRTSAFLMGGLSGLIIGPCTTPVIGSILAYVAARQNVFLGITLLFVYALGMGTPLLILGLFVGILKKLPKAGIWMVKIKKVFGLLLIAGAEYLLLGASQI
ncbi:MAG: sulfite exporter TauE/SafE family protein [Candidatus Omnitrophica bacterium]|nr:sulfite exporter TauE/SafE family protein [Candidatus Omnitrophota bacterium]MBU2063923.1 sulfite exporter TauE/SafE family protein [Candidatus Omnitrophota bacterium]